MLDFLVTTSRGLDDLLLIELRELCPNIHFKSKPGHVLFSAELEEAYTICMWSRLANRVLLQLAAGEIKSAEDLYQLASSVNWSAQFTLEQDFAVDFVGTNRTINNSQFGALKIKDAIVDQFVDLFDKRPSVNKVSPKIKLQGRLWRDHLGIFLDLSGQSLHQRQYRQQTGAAPLKEHVACAMLMRSGWTKQQSSPLIDPMCGSGTIAIEAALIAMNRAPGIQRAGWGFEHWSGHQPELWEALKDSASKNESEPQNQIIANDVDKRVLNYAKQNADKAGVFKFITFKNVDALKLAPEANMSTGFLVSNPPYGERLSELTQLLPLFQNWGAQLKEHFKDWKVSLLTANRDVLRQLKLVAKKEYKLMNGKLECLLVNYELDERNTQIREQANPDSDFSNRLSKNLKRLNKWLNSQNTNCYRIYDADLPEFNVAIDRYADWLVVQEYAPPKDIPEQKAKKRLHDVIVQLPAITGVSSSNIVLKTRAQQKGLNQYQKFAEKGQTFDVYENGAKFKVNLYDYLDTGLFLDHRITRQVVKDLSKGKDVLNLFAYTGSVSVHAALGGARSVTTVDMSKTYLDWAKDNFSINNLKGAYAFFQADCLDWLSSHTNQYDLIFIDPPSFSNSKRMQSTWDVQRDHVELILNAKRCLSPAGKIVFSNNLRQFKLDKDALENAGFNIENISQRTLPEDFKRNPKIHQCWILSLG